MLLSGPGKGPPPLNICTSTRLITHNTPQPLPSLSPPQRSLETREGKGEGENSVTPRRAPSYNFITVFFSIFFSPGLFFSVFKDDESQLFGYTAHCQVNIFRILYIIFFHFHLKCYVVLIRKCFTGRRCSFAFPLPLPYPLSLFPYVVTLNFCYLLCLFIYFPQPY